MNYLYEFAAIGAVTGITGLLSDKLKTGMGKAVNFVSCLVLMLCILTPVVTFIKRDGFVGSFPKPEVTEEKIDDGKYLEKLKKLTEERLTLMENNGIKSRFGYDKEDLEIIFKGTIENGEYRLTEIDLCIKSIGALSRRDEITSYLSEKYLCKITVKEEIINNQKMF